MVLKTVILFQWNAHLRTFWLKARMKMSRYINQISPIYRCIDGYRHDTCRRNISHLILFLNPLKWPKIPLREGRVALPQTTPTQPTPPASIARQPNVCCTPAHHSPLQYLNKVFWCNQLSMWDCNCTPDHPLIFPHQHQSTNHASFDKMFTFYVYMQICTLLALNILTITTRKMSSLRVFHR